MASTEGSGILETGNLETAKRALDAEGFRHFQILRLVFKSEMTRCAQAHPSRAKALQIQIARRGLGPLRGRSNSASRRANRPCAARGRLIIMPWRRCRRKRTPGRWRTTSCFLGSRQRPFLSTFFGASTDIYLISHLGSRMGAQGSSCGGECDAVPDEETLRLMRRSQSAATRRAAEGWCAGLYCVMVEACVDKLQ
jgi:hypothetical protein